MQRTRSLLFLAAAIVLPAVAKDGTAGRMGKAAAVLTTMTESTHGIPADKLAGADCIAVIPGFKKGAAVVGVGYGRGFISCRNSDNWSSPAAITLETGSLGIQLGGEEMDIVVLSMDKALRSKLLSDRFAIGSDASAAWGNGKAAHDDSNAGILFYGKTKGAFAGFDLDGATLKSDDSGNQALYRKPVTNDAIVEGEATPTIARLFVAELDRASKR